MENQRPLGKGKGKYSNFPTRKKIIEAPNELYFQHGKVPPQAVDLEEAVLGAMMLSRESMLEVIGFLKPEHMYKEGHQVILKAIISLAGTGRPVDILTVTEELRRSGELEVAGGPYYITMTTNRVASPANINYHGRLVHQYFLKREIIRIGSEIVKKGYEDTEDVFDLIDELKEAIKQLDLEKESFSMGSNMVADEVMRLQKGFKDKKKINMFSYQTQWPKLNDLVVIGPRKFWLCAGGAKHGKTKWLCAMLFHMLEQYPKGISVFWNTYEDSRMDIIYHYVASKLKIKVKALQTGKYDPELTDAVYYWVNQFRKFDVELIDKAQRIKPIVSQFNTFCAARPNTLNILVVDNVMALKDKNDFKHNPNDFYDYAIAEAALAMEAQNAWVICLHHYNDEQMNPDNLKTAYRPIMKHIKGTEASRRKPTAVLLMNNPNTYKDLMTEYSGDVKDNLKDIFIVDVAGDRDDNVHDEGSVIRFWKSLDYNIFEQIEIEPEDVEQGEEHSNEMPF